MQTAWWWTTPHLSLFSKKERSPIPGLHSKNTFTAVKIIQVIKYKTEADYIFKKTLQKQIIKIAYWIWKELNEETMTWRTRIKEAGRISWIISFFFFNSILSPRTPATKISNVVISPSFNRVQRISHSHFCLTLVTSSDWSPLPTLLYTNILGRYPLFYFDYFITTIIPSYNLLKKCITKTIYYRKASENHLLLKSIRKLFT